MLPVTMVGPTIIHHNKSGDTYESAMRCIANTLIGMGITGNMKDAMLDIVFGEHGLIKAENKQDLTEKMKDAITLLSEMEKHCLSQNDLLNNNGLFSSYIESGKKTAPRKIIKI